MCRRQVVLSCLFRVFENSILQFYLLVKTFIVVCLPIYQVECCWVSLFLTAAYCHLEVFHCIELCHNIKTRLLRNLGIFLCPYRTDNFDAFSDLGWGCSLVWVFSIFFAFEYFRPHRLCFRLTRHPTRSELRDRAGLSTDRTQLCGARSYSPQFAFLQADTFSSSCTLD